MLKLHLIDLFSPLGKLAGRAIYFTCVNFFFFYYEQSYLSIYWTDFHDLFTKWKVFAWIFLILSIFSDSSRDMATNFVSYQTCSLGAKVSQDLLDRFSQSAPYGRYWIADDHNILLFSISIGRGTLPWQSIDFGKMSWTPTDTTCILCTIVRKRVGISLSKCVR